MALVINVKPETEAELRRQATARGVGAEVYAAGLLEQAICGESKRGRMNPEELAQFFRDMAQFSEKTPVLPDDAFTREGIYQNHD